MIQLNIAILEYIEAKNDFSMRKANRLSKKNVQRCENKVKRLESKLILDYPQFKQIIMDHTSDYISELTKERVDFFDYINDGEIHKMTQEFELEELDKELLRRITFMAFCLGRYKADDVLNGIRTNKNIELPSINGRYKIKRYEELLVRNKPQMEGIIVKYVNDNIARSQEIHEQKIEKLHRPIEAVLDDISIVNLTKINIAEDILMGLSFGPKFCFPTKDNLDNKIMFIDYFIEHLELSFPVETHLECYKQLSIEMSRENRREKTVREIWLDLINYRIRSFKFENPDVCITKSDKGKHTVIMSNDEYIKKMDDLIISTDDYVRVDTVDIRELEIKNNNFVKNLRENSVPFVENCYDACTTISQMYGLVKIHKKGNPVRPITAACAAPGFKLAKFCTRVLSEVFCEDGFHVRNSLQFVEGLKNIRLDEDEVMVSFDVVSMFTNIPVDHMILLIAEREKDIFDKFKIKFNLFKEILIFLLKECAIFSWNKNIYRQKDSLAMGSPMSPILAKILMTRIIEFTLTRIPSMPRTLALYVDDSFWILRWTQVEKVLGVMNSYHKKIKFTVEREEDQSINFLDVTIIRTTDSVTYRWYKKKYASSRLINYFSSHERTCVLETARAYVRMVFSLSSQEFFGKNKIILEEILRKNSFPELEIASIIRENYTFMRPLPKSKGFEGKYVPMKFKRDLSHRLKEKIHPFIPGARLVGVPDRSNSNNFSILKDPIDAGEKSNCVIIFRCECGQKMIMRHTKYLGAAREMINEVNDKFVTEGECSSLQHAFSKCSLKRCSNFTSVKRVFDMYAYSYKDRLIDTPHGLPQFYVTKQLKIAMTNEK